MERPMIDNTDSPVVHNVAGYSVLEALHEYHRRCLPCAVAKHHEMKLSSNEIDRLEIDVHMNRESERLTVHLKIEFQGQW
jgi:hypothetical protein